MIYYIYTIYIMLYIDTVHLKLISHLYDTAQDVLMQFTGRLGQCG